MVKKKTKKKGFVEKYQSSLLILLILLIGGFLLVSNGTITLPQSITNIFNINNFDSNDLESNIDFEGYSLNLNVVPNTICVGDSITGFVTSNIPNGTCTLFVNSSGAWNPSFSFNLNANGAYTATQVIDVAGSAFMRVLCCDGEGNCKVSNVEDLVSSVCVDPVPEGVRCSDAVVPLGTGDVGAFCDSLLPCLTKTNCDNYFDPTVSLHKCGCTDTFFCQLNYSYPYGSTCECPPNSTQVVGNDVGEIMCVSN